MQQITVELEDKDMAQLEALAQASCIDPAIMVRAEVLKVLALSDQVGASEVARSVVAAVLIEPRDDSPAAQAARRLTRIDALTPSSGIWNGELNKPKDGVAYQEAMRAEWP